MKKLMLVVLAVMMAVSASFAKENSVNVLAGLDFAGNMSFSGDGSGNLSTDVGISLGAEYFRSLGDVCAIGLGVQYLAERNTKKGADDHKASFSLLPIYTTFKLTPIPSARGVYFKLDLGYSALLSTGEFWKNWDKSGGLYFGAGAGYEFDFGLVLGGAYGLYNETLKNEDTKIGFSYSKFTVNAGYKFSF